jgi:polyisoprenoid-binding protein YceI
MNCRQVVRFVLAAIAVTVVAATGQTTAYTSDLSTGPLTLASARVSIAGTSNIHAFTASTTEVRLLGVTLAGDLTPTLWEGIVKPGAMESFEVAIAAKTLSSPRDGLDKNMHKALKVSEYPDITFSLRRLDAQPSAPEAGRAQGLLKIAGVEREVAFDITTHQTRAALTVRGEVPLLMTDYGITPPKAMLGMLKTDPKVTVTFEVSLTARPYDEATRTPTRTETR